MVHRGLLLGLLMMVSSTLFANERPKLLYYGWDNPSIEGLVEHGDRLSGSPFDGTAIQLPGRQNVFMSTRLPVADFEADRVRAGSLDLPKLANSFLVMHAAASDDFDWRDEAHWAASLDNIRQFAALAKAIGLRGIVFDMEPYGKSPWTFATQKGADALGFAAYSGLVRQRGRDMIQAMEAEFPGLHILCLYGASAVGDIIRAEQRPEKIQAALAGANYGLWPAMLSGWLEAGSAALQVTEGNEPAYHYTRASDFISARGFIRERLPAALPFEARPFHDRKVKVGSAVYVDGVLDLHQSPRFIGYYLKTKADRLSLLQNNIVNALKTSDTFVWVYHEQARRFSGMPDPDVDKAITKALELAGQDRFADDDFKAIVSAKLLYDKRISVGGHIRGADGRGIRVERFEPEEAHRACSIWGDEGAFGCDFPHGWSGSIRPVLKGSMFEPRAMQFRSMTKSQWGLRFDAR